MAHALNFEANDDNAHNLTLLKYVFVCDQIINDNLAGRVLQLSLADPLACLDLHVCVGPINTSLDFISNYHPHAVFLDVDLPGLSETKALTVVIHKILLMGDISPQVVLMGTPNQRWRVGADDMMEKYDHVHVIDKPFTIGEFQKTTAFIQQSINMRQECAQGIVREHHEDDTDLDGVVNIFREEADSSSPTAHAMQTGNDRLPMTYCSNIFQEELGGDQCSSLVGMACDGTGSSAQCNVSDAHKNGHTCI